MNWSWWLFTASVAAVLVITACSVGSSRAVPPPAGVVSAAPTTAAPAKPTTAPPTIAPTVAPTMAPTIAPTVTPTVAPTVAPSPTIASTATAEATPATVPCPSPPAAQPAPNSPSLGQGGVVPFTWQFPGFGCKALALSGTARLDHVSPSSRIVDKGELTVTGPGYSSTETFLRTGSQGTGTIAVKFASPGYNSVTTGSFSWQRSTSGGNVQMKLVRSETGQPSSTMSQEISYTLANGLMGIRITSHGTNCTATSTGKACTSGTGEESAYLQPSSHRGTERVALCDTGDRSSCESVLGYNGPSLPNAVLAVQTWEMMDLTTWIAFHTPSQH